MSLVGHGWVSRGDGSNEEVKRDIQLAMDEATAYFRVFLPTNN